MLECQPDLWINYDIIIGVVITYQYLIFYLFIFLNKYHYNQCRYIATPLAPSKMYFDLPKL